MTQWYTGFEGYYLSDLRHALRQADLSIFESALIFLEDDSMVHGTGYLKEVIWHYIRRYELNESDLERLYNVALKYLERPMSHEFKYMCLAMAHLGDASFWQKVKEASEGDNPRAQVNAYCLLPYAESIEAGERNRLELHSLKFRSYYYKYRVLDRTQSDKQ